MIPAYNCSINILISRNSAMHELQALLQGKIPPQAISVNFLIEMAERHTNLNSAEYKLVELAINMILAHTLDQALQHL